MGDVHANSYRLPTNVKPRHYDLTIRTDFERLKFGGLVNIHLDVVKETRSIQFHALKLKLGEARLFLSLEEGDVVIKQRGDDLVFSAEQERATMVLPRTIPAGSKALLTLEFEAELGDTLTGYYRSAWECEGKTAYYALTHFEPTAARRAFPCWDEPALKATFSIRLASRASMVNLSNMPTTSEKTYVPYEDPNDEVATWLSSHLAHDEHDLWKVTHFRTTPLMSTYIVAWASGPFSFLESSYTSQLTGKSRPLRIYATRDLIHQGQFALDVLREVVPRYETVFDIEYPLPKLDLLVATDFKIGAMENWGLITGRATAFLLDHEHADLSGKRWVASMVCHEVAHMWFGNITTMEWWDTVYLKEGFARLLGETVILGRIFPDWRLATEFVTSAMDAAMFQDAKLSSHPVEVECPDANVANQIFDALSYDKGATVLRMLSYYAGEDAFFKGASIYLKKHLYGTAVTKDLWDGVQEATGLPVPHIMDNWVKKMGYPVITVREEATGIRLRQDRFLETGPATPEHNETIWSIPLSLLSIGQDRKPSVNRTVLLDTREKTIELDMSKPFKLNAGTVSMYRVLYLNPKRVGMIAREALKKNSGFSLEDKLGLMIDAIELERTGYPDTKLSSVLDLYEIFRKEEDYCILSTIADGLNHISSVWFQDGDIIRDLDHFRRILFVPIVDQLGMEYPKDSQDEPTERRQMRTLAITQAAHGGEMKVVDHLIKLFKEATKNGDFGTIPADLMRITYRIAVKYGGRKEYDAMKGIALKPVTPQSGVAAMQAMGATLDHGARDDLWAHIMKKARNQDLFSYFSGLQANHSSRRFLAEQFKKDYYELEKRTLENFMLQDLVRYAFVALSSERDYEETKAFFKDKNTSTFEMSLNQVLDNIKARGAWVKRSTGDLREWLRNKNKDEV